jgi:hypothetical protein
MPSGSCTGATGVACADVVTAKAKAAKAINLIIRSSQFFKKRFFLKNG